MTYARSVVQNCLARQHDVSDHVAKERDAGAKISVPLRKIAGRDGQTRGICQICGPCCSQKNPQLYQWHSLRLTVRIEAINRPSSCCFAVSTMEVVVEESAFEQSSQVLTGATGRRNALGAISSAGMALLAAIGLATGSEAKKNKSKGGGNNHKDRNQAEKKKGGGKGKPGPTGPTGPTGPAGGGTGAGATGPPGPTGPAGPSQVSVTRVGAEDSGSQFLTSTANCEPGEHAVGGGYVSLFVESTVADRPVPVDAGSTPTGWLVSGSGTAPQSSIRAYVVCVPN